MTIKPLPKPVDLSRRPTVRVKPFSYQPSKAELEAPFSMRKKDGSLPTPGELARGALRQMKVVEDSEA